MKKRRITIEVEESIDDWTAIKSVLKVVEGGKVSVGANDKEHYCWLTISDQGIAVSSKPKYGTDSDRFLVYGYGGE